MKASILVVAVILLSACGGSSQGSKVTSNRYVITEEEIQNSTATNAYELIRMKRPEFLRPQGPKAVVPMASSTRLPVVYVNGLRYGELEELTKIPAEMVKEVRYLNERDANLQLGLGNPAGAILVTTKK